MHLWQLQLHHLRRMTFVPDRRSAGYKGHSFGAILLRHRNSARATQSRSLDSWISDWISGFQLDSCWRCMRFLLWRTPWSKEVDLRLSFSYSRCRAELYVCNSLCCLAVGTPSVATNEQLLACPAYCSLINVLSTVWKYPFPCMPKCYAWYQVWNFNGNGRYEFWHMLGFLLFGYLSWTGSPLNWLLLEIFGLVCTSLLLNSTLWWLHCTCYY